jgi:hypothetical protein
MKAFNWVGLLKIDKVPPSNILDIPDLVTFILSSTLLLNDHQFTSKLAHYVNFKAILIRTFQKRCLESV